MLSLYNFHKQYGDQILFENESFSIAPGEHIGLVGRNGYGKTTLFRILTGEEHCDNGEIIIPKGYTIGCLSQDISLHQPTILAEGCLGLPENEKTHDWTIKKILAGFGFSENDMLRSPAEFSSGFQMRVALTKVLAGRPDLLLLDEPTNFLDILSIRWFSRYLRSWPGEMIIISHDHTFINSIITHTMGIHRKHIRKIKGGTDKYHNQIQQEEKVYERQRINEQKYRDKEEEYINKFRAKARRASQVQSRLKKLEKITVLNKLDNIEDLSFNFNYKPIPSKNLLHAENICFRYSDSNEWLINDFSITVKKSDKICVIGKNGAGKSTLLKLLGNKLEPKMGEIKSHPSLKTAFFEHAGIECLNKDNTIEEEILNSLDVKIRNTARSICGAMMFSGDNALKKINVLSGGERYRVLLGKILASPANLLLLDEPSHHLDMESCQAIIDSIHRFEGGAVVVTHDERILRQLAKSLIIIQEGKILFFSGTYDEFLEQIGWSEEYSVKNNKNISKKKYTRKERAQYIQKKSRVLTPLKQKITDIEKEIVVLETKQSELTENMVKVSEQGDAEKIKSVAKHLKDIEIQIDNTYNELIPLTEKYEILKEKFEKNED